MYEPITVIPDDLRELREQFKNKLYIGALGVAKTNTLKAFKRLGMDQNTSYALVRQHQEQAHSTHEADWAAEATQELADVLGDAHLAHQFMAIYIIDNEANSICNAAYMIHEREQAPQKTNGAIAELEALKKQQKLLVAQTKVFVRAFSQQDQSAANKVVDAYVKELEKNIGADQHHFVGRG